MLLDLLGEYEMEQAPVGGERVTVGVVHDVLGAALHDERIDVGWSEQHQLDELLAMTDDYLGVTDGEALQRIVAHRALTNALIRQLLEQTE